VVPVASAENREGSDREDSRRPVRSPRYALRERNKDVSRPSGELEIGAVLASSSSGHEHVSRAAA
jgi:hypothetical protein